MSARSDDAAARATDSGLQPERLAERMRHLKVPGLSLAVIDGHRIACARGFGVQEEDGAAVTPDSLFQAASMSKPVAAAVALTLVEQNKLGLDEPANLALKQWRLPDSPIAPASGVTLRRLLSHSAGLTVHGFEGYTAGSPVPTVAQLLDGLSPANSAPVRIDLTPGTQMRYSGGGFTVAQLMVEDVGGKPYAQAAQDLVLSGVGMTASRFAQPLPERLASRAAVGHDSAGQAIPGCWNTYPELAAAGLWTTASDLARFLIAVMKASRGDSEAGLSTILARRLIEPQPGLKADTRSIGLGFFIEGEGLTRRFYHRGANIGYRGFMLALPETGQGAVVMNNGDGGAALVMEIVRSLAATYRWPDADYSVN